MPRLRRLALRSARVALAVAVFAALAHAHFLELIPEHDLVTHDTGSDLALSLTFTHPFAGGPTMAMERPSAFGVIIGGRTVDLSDSLESVRVGGRPAYRARYAVTAPGDHVFYVEPAPYFEEAEGKAIVHYTKVIVNAYALSDGWAQPVGLPVEIRPLARPYDLWAGNLFRGVVLRDGTPVPFAEVEVEWRNDGSVDADAFVFATQVIRADANGTFAYAMPRAGWWGFAALVDGEEPMTGPDGQPWDVELGGLLWLHARAVE